MQALHLMKQEGWKQRDIAVALDVTEGAGSRWLAAARREGAKALLSRSAPGPTPKLTPAAPDPRLPVARRGGLLRLPG
jgi:transposase